MSVPVMWNKERQKTHEICSLFPSRKRFTMSPGRQLAGAVVRKYLSRSNGSVIRAICCCSAVRPPGVVARASEGVWLLCAVPGVVGDSGLAIANGEAGEPV